MAGTTIGEVNISLRMNLAQFKKDVQDGTGAAASGASQLGSAMSGSTQQARESLRLLSEEIGVHIPRGLQTFVAELPGVGTALNLAFNSVAVLALIEIIVKVADKLSELKKNAEAFQKALADGGATGTQELNKLDEEVLKLQAQFDALTGHTLKALQEELELINLERLDAISKQFDDLNAKAQKTLDLLNVGGFANFFGLGNNQAVQVVKQDLTDIVEKVHELKAAGDTTGIGALLDAKIAEVKSFKDVAFENDPHPEVRQQAMNFELQQLQQLKAEYADINKSADLHTKILSTTAANNALKQEQTDLKNLQTAYDALVKQFNVPQPSALDMIFRQGTNVEAQIRSMAAENPALFKKAFPNDSVDTVVFALQKFARQAEDLAMHKALQDLNTEIASLANNKLPDLGQLQTQLPTLAKNASVPTAGQMELEKITNSQKDAAAEAQKVIDSIETENQKFKDQAAMLTKLKQEGLLTQQQFSTAMAKAAADTDKANKQWSTFGEAVGKDIEQTMLFGKSWSDSIKLVITQLIALIVQMTLLKDLQASLGGGGGAGGFLSGLVGGLFGGKKAAGGYVDSSHAYIVGENGPEMFMPNGSGSIVPNGALQGGGNSTQVNYNIDARGADAGVEQRLRAAISESEGRAVARAVITTQEISKRRVS